MTVHHPDDDEVDVVAGRVVAELDAYARANPLMSAVSDRAELAGALRAQRAQLWVLGQGVPRAHLYGAVLGASSAATAYTGPDGSSGTTEDLAQLLEVAAPSWRASGARSHHVWVPDDSPGLSAWRQLGYEEFEARGLRALDGLTAPRRRDVVVHVEVNVEVALDFEDVIDATHGVEVARGRARRGRRRELARLLDEPDTAQYLASSPEGTLAQCICFPSAPTRGTPARTLHLSAVAVAAEARRRGVGRHLIESVLAGALAQGYSHAEVVWRTANARAGAFWAACGFEVTTVRLRRNL